MGKRKDLRERVQHQAYLYRVNADLRGDKIHPLVDLSETTPRADRRENKGQQVTLLGATFGGVYCGVRSVPAVSAVFFRN